jgi:ATP-binding cassette subfamily C protein CydC
MTARSPVGEFIAQQVRLRRRDLAIAAFAGASVTAAATWLLGLSGWFLAGAALAGAAGPLAVQGFNYLLPSAGFRALAIGRTAGRYGERLFSHRAALSALAALRPALFAGLAAAPPEQALALSSGEASARLVQDVNAIETEFVRRSAPWAAAAAAGAACVLIDLASASAAIAFVVGLCAQLLVGRLLGERLTWVAGGERLRASGRLKAGLVAYLQAAAELYCFDLTPRAVDALMVHDAALSRAGVARNDAEALLALLQAVLVALTLLAVVVAALAAPLPLMALAVLAALAGMEGVGALLRAAQQQGAYREAVARLDSVLVATRASGAAPPARAAIAIDARRLQPGERLGVIGPSGCGKSLLLEALVGLRRAPPGRIAIDGRPLEAEAPGWARPLFAYAPQDARLLTGTIAENLRLAAPQASESALWAVLADAQLDARVRRLADGLDSWIGDGGEALSGGERRRLALARAYLRAAPWLVLDEPTEGLDAGTEAALVAALDQRLSRSGQGLVIVSHRPAPLRLCTATLDVAGRLDDMGAPGDVGRDDPPARIAPSGSGGAWRGGHGDG